MMDPLQEIAERLISSLKSGVKDHSLLQSLKSQLELFQLQASLVLPFFKLSLMLYDISNSLALTSLTKEGVEVNHDPLGVEIKLLSFKMLASLIDFCSSGNGYELQASLLREGFEVMVLSARVLIELKQISQIAHMYPLVGRLFQAVRGTSAENEALHFLNTAEVMRMQTDSGNFDAEKFRDTLSSFFSLCPKIKQAEKYIQLGQLITLEAALKLLKKGDIDQCRILKPLLPQKLLAQINGLLGFEQRCAEGKLQVSPFYQLLLSLKGIGEGVTEEKVRSFLYNSQNLHDPRVFDVVVLSNCPLPLEIWLQAYVNTRERSEKASLAFRCYSHLVDSATAEAQDNQRSLQEKFNKRINSLQSLLKASQLICLALLLQKKQTQEPVLGILKRSVKILVHCAVSCFPHPKDLVDMAERILLVCSKFSFLELSRSVSSILFYYQLLSGTANNESFSRFHKSNLMEKNAHLFRALKLAYDLKSGSSNVNLSQIETLAKQPYIAVLFLNNRFDLPALIPPHKFSALPQKFEIYSLILVEIERKKVIGECTLQKITQHMEEVFIAYDFSQLTTAQLQNVSLLSASILSLLQRVKDQANDEGKRSLAICGLYASCLSSYGSKMQSLNLGLTLNRYSKLVKTLNFCLEIGAASSEQIFINSILYLSKCLLCWSLEVLKVKQSQVCNLNQPGSSLLYDIQLSIICQHEKSLQSVEFMKFVRFQLSCLADTVNQVELLLEKNTKLLRLYAASKYAKKGVKLKLLRRIVKDDLVTNSRQTSMEDLNSLIGVADSLQEKKMYAEYLMKLFGEKGKQYLIAQSSLHPSLYEFLSKQGAPEREEDFL